MLKKIMILSMVLVSCNLVASDIKLGVVDFQTAMETVKDGEKAKKKLEEEFNEKQKLIQKREEEIKKLTENFQKQAPLLTQDKREKEQQSIQKKILEYQTLIKESESAMQKRQVELTQPIIKSMRSVIDDISKKENLDLVYEKNQSGILYSKNPTDITNEVIKKYNEIHN
ncbi:MAG: OmpH family outer membrane protein [Candidatus Pacebacteria bacterium]|nr:OmpH family outer membrane protein [Candidatus Paceibacterota bacterium]